VGQQPMGPAAVAAVVLAVGEVGRMAAVALASVSVTAAPLEMSGNMLQLQVRWRGVSTLWHGAVHPHVLNAAQEECCWVARMYWYVQG